MDSNTHTPTGITAFAQALNSDKGIQATDIKDEDLPAFYWFRRLGLLEFNNYNGWSPTIDNNRNYISRHTTYRFKHRT